MERIHENFYVERSPVYELFNLLLRLANNKNEKKETFHEPDTEKLNDWIQTQRESLPDSIVEELNLFFHPDSFFGLSMTQVFYQKGTYDSVEESVELLKSKNAEKLVYFFFNTGQNTLEDRAIIQDPAKVYEHINKSTLPQNEKTKLFFLYFNPEETMKRFVRLIEFAYEKIYKQIATELEKIQLKGMELLKEMSVKQLVELLRFDADSPEKLPNTIIIFPSYYHQDNAIFSYDGGADIAISIAGIQLIENVLDGANMEETVIELARALSDSKRINIIRELNKSPHYGYELAQKLNLSSPTISHHMNVLFRLGLVTTSKYENKIYYEVNKEKLRQSIKEMSDFLS